MSGRKPARFTEADVSRAIKGAQKANLPVRCVHILKDGTIQILPGVPEPVPVSPPNPWDE